MANYQVPLCRTIYPVGKSQSVGTLCRCWLWKPSVISRSRRTPSVRFANCPERVYANWHNALAASSHLAAASLLTSVQSQPLCDGEVMEVKSERTRRLPPGHRKEAKVGEDRAQAPCNIGLKSGPGDRVRVCVEWTGCWMDLKDWTGHQSDTVHDPSSPRPKDVPSDCAVPLSGTSILELFSHTLHPARHRRSWKAADLRGGGDFVGGIDFRYQGLGQLSRIAASLVAV
jgi:hypothetical protein